MRKTILITGLVLLLSKQSPKAQLHLQWGSSFSPSWSNGALSRNAPNISGYSVGCNASVSINGGGSFQPAMGSYGSQSPTVSGAVFTVPGATSRIQVTPNFNNKNSYTTISLSFTTLATNVSFRIADIDKNDAYSDTYFDRVTITGSNGSSTFNPTITKYDAVTDPNFLIISGNSARVNTTNGQAGNTDSDASDQRGTINVDFGTAAINTITIIYDNAPGSDNNPAVQSIAIGNVSFTQSILPVNLTDFSGYRQSQDVLLKWTTRQESNSASFDIERSTDNTNWKRIGSVAAAGFSNNDLYYSFRDVNPQGAVLLYRLKQVDTDNNYKYSSVVRIAGKTIEGSLQLYPNPVKDQLGISLRSSQQQTVSLSFTDLSGKLVKQENKNLYAGENNIMVTNFGTITRGIYLLTIRDAGRNVIASAKFVKD